MYSTARGRPEAAGRGTIRVRAVPTEPLTALPPLQVVYILALFLSSSYQYVLRKPLHVLRFISLCLLLTLGSPVPVYAPSRVSFRPISAILVSWVGNLSRSGRTVGSIVGFGPIDCFCEFLAYFWPFSEPIRAPDGCCAEEYQSLC